MALVLILYYMQWTPLTTEVRHCALKQADQLVEWLGPEVKAGCNMYAKADTYSTCATHTVQFEPGLIGTLTKKGE